MKKTCAMCEFRPPNLNSDSVPFFEGNDKRKTLKKEIKGKQKGWFSFFSVQDLVQATNVQRFYEHFLFTRLH